ncbi:hypothetical protein PEBR_40672 [Penicillium brasilianum]|uniref:Uncharacterized protein n=1 Tax=Penicillium brasilianum TaxID=104259 RepID=A0A1S9R9E3_PENBI|nr:hypothetical protein PEBR_40672 [Penicillium brasilianum]
MRAGDWGTREWKECVKDSRLNSLLWGASRGLTCATFLTPPHFDSFDEARICSPTDVFGRTSHLILGSAFEKVVSELDWSVSKVVALGVDDDNGAIA